LEWRWVLLVYLFRGGNSDQAKCDGPCALPLYKLEPYLAQMKAVDDLVKSFKPVIIE
jgi:2-dehydro-3-deoxyphosphooctonate aldolase (KDO 8-P synthase)